ncbi:MAG: GDSL-type esterase/lipase family protein [Bacteroidota bacterium]
MLPSSVVKTGLYDKLSIQRNDPHSVKISNHQLFSFILSLLFSHLITAQETDDPRRWQADIDKFAAADALAPVKPEPILFVGSSSIVFWESLAEDFPNVNTLNRGFGGSQFSDLLYWADRVIFKYRPRAIFVYEGDNDVNAGDRPRRILREAKKLRRLISKNLGKEVPVYFISPKPSIARWQLKAQYEATNRLLEQYTLRKKFTYFIDVWNPALDASGAVLSDIFVEDQLHMNAKGYAIWAEVIRPWVEQLQ